MAEKPKLIGIEQPAPQEAAQQMPDEFPIGPCEDCIYGVFHHGLEIQMGDCRKNLPHVVIFMAPNRLGQPATQTASAWPTVGRRQGCGEFKPKKADMQ